jgi:hypothetical protein
VIRAKPEEAASFQTSALFALSLSFADSSLFGGDPRSGGWDAFGDIPTHKRDRGEKRERILGARISVLGRFGVET